MCFRWLKTLYHCLRRKCSRRNRGYSREMSLSHGGFCSASFSNRHGRASFSCGREGSLSYSRRPSSCPAPPAPAPCSISGGFSCDTHGSLVLGGGEGGGWDVTVGPGYGGEGAGSRYRPGGLGSAEGAGAGYGYAEPLGDSLTAGGVPEGSGYHGGGLGYGAGTLPGPELGSAGEGCAQVVQQKCPVVVPPIKTQQCKQSPRWPLVQKK